MEHKDWSRVLSLFAIVGIVMLMIMEIAVLRESPMASDDLTLFNPVYMKLNYGEMTYPVHGWHHSTIVHPPIHYQVIAFFMRLGMNSHYAYGMPVIISALLLCMIVAVARFSIKFSVSVLLSLFVLMIFQASSIRPDVTIAITWLAGLLALEAGRQRNWSVPLLATGSVLLIYASMLHYYAAFSFLGIGVYVLYLFSDKQESHRFRKLIALTVPALIIGIAYLLFYIIPNYDDILYSITRNQGEGGTLQALSKHLEFYRGIYINHIINRDGYLHPKAIGWLAFIIAFSLMIYARLLYKRETRVLVLASLPLTLMVLFISRGKSSGYFIPEILILSFGTLYVLISVFYKVLCSYFQKRMVNKTTASAIAVLFVLLFGFSCYNFKYRTHEMHLARACGMDINESKNPVGSRMNSWYTSGGTEWENIAMTLDQDHVYTKKELRNVLGQFNTVAESRHMSGENLAGGENLISWYNDSLLALNGFYFSQNMSGMSELSTLFLSPGRDEFKMGYGFDGKELFKYIPNENGEIVMLAFELPKRNEFTVDHFMPLVNASSFLSVFMLPSPSDKETSELIFMIIGYDGYVKNISILPQEARIREVKQLEAQRADPAELLEFTRNTPAMRFLN